MFQEQHRQIVMFYYNSEITFKQDVTQQREDNPNILYVIHDTSSHDP